LPRRHGYSRMTAIGQKRSFTLQKMGVYRVPVSQLFRD
jgi:hypothetical protein